MISSRVLPLEEYPRLKGTELETIWPILPPGANVIVVEDAGEIVAGWALFPVVHAEGLWVSPSKRGRAGTARLLLNKTYEVAREMGMKALITSTINEKVESLIGKVGGVALPGKHFAINIQENL